MLTPETFAESFHHELTTAKDVTMVTRLRNIMSLHNLLHPTFPMLAAVLTARRHPEDLEGREEYKWEVSTKELRMLIVFLPIFSVVFAAGGAYMAVRGEINSKASKGDVRAIADTISARFSKHEVDQSLLVQQIRATDSLQWSAIERQEQRFIEVYCGPKKGCR